MAVPRPTSTHISKQLVQLLDKCSLHSVFPPSTSTLELPTLLEHVDNDLLDTPQDYTRSPFSSAPQRQSLFIDELPTAYILLQCPFRGEEEFTTFLNQLNILVEAYTVGKKPNEAQHSERQATQDNGKSATVPLKELICSRTVSGEDDPEVAVHEHQDEDTGNTDQPAQTPSENNADRTDLGSDGGKSPQRQSVWVLWKVRLHIPRARIHSVNPSLYLSLTGTLQAPPTPPKLTSTLTLPSRSPFVEQTATLGDPQPSENSASGFADSTSSTASSSDDYLPSSTPVSPNLFAALAHDPSFTNHQAPILPAERLVKHAPRTMRSSSSALLSASDVGAGVPPHQRSDSSPAILRNRYRTVLPLLPCITTRLKCAHVGQAPNTARMLLTFEVVISGHVGRDINVRVDEATVVLEAGRAVSMAGTALPRECQARDVLSYIYDMKPFSHTPSTPTASSAQSKTESTPGDPPKHNSLGASSSSHTLALTVRASVLPSSDAVHVRKSSMPQEHNPTNADHDPSENASNDQHLPPTEIHYLHRTPIDLSPLYTTPSLAPLTPPTASQSTHRPPLPRTSSQNKASNAQPLKALPPTPQSPSMPIRPRASTAQRPHITLTLSLPPASSSTSLLNNPSKRQTQRQITLHATNRHPNRHLRLRVTPLLPPSLILRYGAASKSGKRNQNESQGMSMDENPEHHSLVPVTPYTTLKLGPAGGTAASTLSFESVKTQSDYTVGSDSEADDLMTSALADTPCGLRIFDLDTRSSVDVPGAWMPL